MSALPEEPEELTKIPNQVLCEQIEGRYYITLVQYQALVNYTKKLEAQLKEPTNANSTN